jgi:hypothetical protein
MATGSCRLVLCRIRSQAPHHIGASQAERQAKGGRCPPKSNKHGASIMKTIASAALAFSILAGIAGQVYAESVNEMSPNQPGYIDQLDRESRGGQGQ